MDALPYLNHVPDPLNFGARTATGHGDPDDDQAEHDQRMSHVASLPRPGASGDIPEHWRSRRLPTLRRMTDALVATIARTRPDEPRKFPAHHRARGAMPRAAVVLLKLHKDGPMAYRYAADGTFAGDTLSAWNV